MSTEAGAGWQKGKCHDQTKQGKLEMLIQQTESQEKKNAHDKVTPAHSRLKGKLLRTTQRMHLTHKGTRSRLITNFSNYDRGRPGDSKLEPSNSHGGKSLP